MRIYIAGPMRGYKAYNFPEFFDEEKRLVDEGHAVVNPAKIDLLNGFDPFNDDVSEKQYEEFLANDFNEIDKCDGVMLLAGWDKSPGSKREREYAISHGKRIFMRSEIGYGTYEWMNNEWISIGKQDGQTDQRLRDCKIDILDEAKLLTASTRRQEYSPPKEDFNRQARLWSVILNCQVSERQVALCLIAMKLARATQSKKRDTWVDIAGYAHCGWEVDGEP